MQSCESVTETWVECASLKGLYCVSNLGRVRGLDRVVDSSYGAKRTVKGRILSQSPKNGQYKHIHIQSNGKKKNYLVHRLVAEAFVPNPNNLPYVNHKDGDKLNNRSENLEWVTHRENIRHAVRTGLLSLEKKVRCISTGEEFDSVYRAAEARGKHPGNLCTHLKGRQKTFDGHKWEYA